MADSVLRFEFLAADHFSPVAERVDRKLEGVGERLGAVGKIAKFALGTLAVGGIAAFGYEMVKGTIAATAYQTLQLKTAAVLKSTGDVAHMSVAKIDELAHSLQETSGVEEALIINSENVLLTFTHVQNRVGKGNDIFNQATGAILDMSVALGEDLQSATIQVGKALQDPVKGVTALRRVGVMLTDQQVKQIKVMVQHGNIMGAQKIILHELAVEFGGAAKAAGQGFGGALARVKFAIDDAFRNIMLKLLPALTTAANWLAEKLPGAIDTAGRVLGRLGSFIKTDVAPKIAAGLAAVTPLVKTAFEKVKTTVMDLFSKIAPKIKAIDWGAVVGKAKDIGKKVTDVLIPLGKTVFDTAKAWAARILDGITTGMHTGNWKPLGQALGDGLFAALSGLTTMTGKIMGAVEGWFASVDWETVGRTVGETAVPFVIGFVTTFFDGIITAAKNHPMDTALFVLAFIPLGKLASAFGPLRSLLEKLPFGKWITAALDHTAAPVFDAIWRFIKFFGKTIGDGFKSVFPEVAGKLGGFFDRIEGAVVSFTFRMFIAGSKMIVGLGEGIGKGLGYAVKAVLWVIDKVTVPFRVLDDWLVPKGLKFMSGLVKGIASAFKLIATESLRVIQWLIAPWNDAQDWLVKHGKDFVGGLLRGIGSVFKNVVAIIIHLNDLMMTPFKAIGSWLVSKGQNFITGFISGVGKMFKSLSNTIGSTILRLTKPFDRSVDWLVQKGKDLLTGIGHGIQKMWGSLSSWISTTINNRIIGPFKGAAKWLWNAGWNVLWGFWDGLKAIWTKVTGWVSGIGSWIAAHKGPLPLDRRLLIPAGVAIMTGFLHGLQSGAGKAWDFVKRVGGKTKEALAAAMGIFQGGGGAPLPGHFSAGVLQWSGQVFEALRMNGLPPSLFNKVMAQMMTESGGNVNAINLWDSNAKAGTPSKGLMQVIQPTFAAWHIPGTSLNIYDPLANIAAALNYARHRYGPNLDGLGQGHGYDTGGYARGAGWFRKGPAPERILSPYQTRIFERWMSTVGRSGHGGHGGVTIILNAPNYVGSRSELLAELNRMAKAGRLDAIVRMAS